MFSRAIVKKPSESLINGLTTAGLGKPDYKLALKQHKNYVTTLKSCGLEIIELQADENFPDSTFVEDVALITPRCAIITNPGAISRRGETAEMREVILGLFPSVEEILSPGTVDAGDIMMVGSHYYIGLSERTNSAGSNQMIEILQSYGMTGSTIKLNQGLHLKTGVAYLENNNLAASGEFIKAPEFQEFNILEIREDEGCAANCIWVNNQVLIPAGFPKTRDTISRAGYAVIEIDVSEFQKLDGGLSCLSLRF